MSNNEETILYKILDLPKIPHNLIELAFNNINGEQNFQHESNRLQVDWNYMKNIDLVIDGVDKKHVPALAWHIDDAIKTWVYDNITDIDVAHVRISVLTPHENNDTCGAHCDRAREYALLYVLEDGGDDAITEFYSEDNCELIREKGYRVLNNDGLTVVGGIHIPLHTWCLLNVRVLHGVRYLQKRRSSIQIGLDSLKGIIHLI